MGPSSLSPSGAGLGRAQRTRTEPGPWSGEKEGNDNNPEEGPKGKQTPDLSAVLAVLASDRHVCLSLPLRGPGGASDTHT